MSNSTATKLDTRSSYRVANETKPAAKTTELIAFVVAVAAVLIASSISDGFDAKSAWLYVTILTASYLVSRGLAKSGTRAHYEDQI